MAEQYSNLNVHGKITQKAAQGTTDDDVLVIKGIAPRSDKPTTSTGASATCFKGQTAVINGATYLCTNVTNNVDESHPLGENTVWTYTWTSVGDPNGVSNPNTSTANHIAVFSDGTGKVIGDSGITIGTAAGATASTHAINSTNAGTTGTKDELTTINQVYTALTNGTVTKVGTSTVGGALQPIYLNSGAPTAGTQLYAKKMTINDTDNTGIIRSADSDLPSIYAPTTLGSEDQFVKGNSSGAPQWQTYYASKIKLNGETTNIMTTGNSGTTNFYAPEMGGQPGDVIRWQRVGSSGGAPVWGGVDYEVTEDSASLITSGAVWTAIDELPEPMLFKGTLGTGGTITSLPSASASNEGWVYKVITAGTYASQAAKIGDLFICANTSTTSTPTYAWTYVPSGDEPSGTVTNVATGVGLTGGPITSSGTIKAKLKSETNATYDSNTITNTENRQYAVVPDKTNGYLSVNVPWTDQSVDAVGHHYSPTATDANKITVSASGGSASWDTNVISGFTVARDAKGHVTGVTPTSVKIPAQPSLSKGTTTGDGNVVTDLSVSGHTVTLTKGITALTSHQTIKQDGITGATANRYAVCSTAAGTAAKTASVTSGTFSLESGARVTVKFDNANTASSSLTLNISGTGAKPILFNDGSSSPNGGEPYKLLKGVCDFIYNGTMEAWYMIGYTGRVHTIYPGSSGDISDSCILLSTLGPAVIGDNASAYEAQTKIAKKLSYTSASGLVIGTQASTGSYMRITPNGDWLYMMNNNSPIISASLMQGVVSTIGFTGDLNGNATTATTATNWSGNPFSATDVTLADM